MTDTVKGKSKATAKYSRVEIREANLTEVPNTKADKNTEKSRRKCRWATSYVQITIPEAEKRWGLRLDLCGIPVKRILEGKHILLGPHMMLGLKRKNYEDLPAEANLDFKEANINDIVDFTIYPIVALFTCETDRKLRLSREKEIPTIDSSTSGVEEFVVMDYISCDQMKYVLVVEAKMAALEEAIKQCLLSLKDMRDCNGGGTVYGFLTMGDSRRMISCDGTFTLSNKLELLFDNMQENKKEWTANYSILVQCFNVALSNGGTTRLRLFEAMICSASPWTLSRMLPSPKWKDIVTPVLPPEHRLTWKSSRSVAAEAGQRPPETRACSRASLVSIVKLHTCVIDEGHIREGSSLQKEFLIGPRTGGEVDSVNPSVQSIRFRGLRGRSGVHGRMSRTGRHLGVRPDHCLGQTGRACRFPKMWNVPGDSHATQVMGGPADDHRKMPFIPRFHGAGLNPQDGRLYEMGTPCPAVLTYPARDARDGWEQRADLVVWRSSLRVYSFAALQALAQEGLLNTDARAGRLVEEDECDLSITNGKKENMIKNLSIHGAPMAGMGQVDLRSENGEVSHVGKKKLEGFSADQPTGPSESRTHLNTPRTAYSVPKRPGQGG
ncbi:hypothetical protein HOY80DRAFT_1034624 [Tuber brumale]|nr:hypothetical protein HOY80DRAFT_1034624 [Tuber brumale]